MKGKPEMTTEEWRSKTDEWRRGWRCCQEAQDIPEEKSQDFIDGYIYALEHPFGSVAIPM